MNQTTIILVIALIYCAYKCLSLNSKNFYLEKELEEVKEELEVRRKAEGIGEVVKTEYSFLGKRMPLWSIKPYDKLQSTKKHITSRK